MYICLEGIDGSGKSTQIELLKQWLNDLGLEAEKVVEPTDSNIGVLIREILLSPNATDSNTQKILALLFAADRLVLMDKIAKLETENKIIISDRSFYSSLVYQQPFDWVLEINKFARKPDLAILLDLDVDLAISRCSQRDEFENKTFLKEVKKKYLDLANTNYKEHNNNNNNNNNNFKIVNGNNGLNKVTSDIKKAIAPLIGVCIDDID